MSTITFNEIMKNKIPIRLQIQKIKKTGKCSIFHLRKTTMAIDYKTIVTFSVCD